MGFFKDNTVEIDVNGVKKRVFKQDADKIKKALATLSKKKESKESK